MIGCPICDEARGRKGLPRRPWPAYGVRVHLEGFSPHRAGELAQHIYNLLEGDEREHHLITTPAADRPDPGDNRARIERVRQALITAPHYEWSEPCQNEAIRLVAAFDALTGQGAGA